MRFSRRTSWDRTPTELTLELLHRRQGGASVVDLTLSNPLACDIPVFPATDFLNTAGMGWAQDARGLLAAREALSSLYRRVGVAVEADALLLTASTSEGYAHLFRLLCDPGDEVLFPRPSYPLLDYLAELHEVALVRYPLVYAGEWHIDLNALRNAVTDRTRAIVLIHPNNPTGSYVKKHERRALIELAQDHDLALIVDEVFWWFPHRSDTPPEESFAAEAEVPTFTLNGISKLFGLPHLKLGWITISDSERGRMEASARLEIIADTFLSVNTPVQHALPNLLRRQPATTEAIRARVQSNLEELRAAVRGTTSVSVCEADGGWSAMLQLPSSKSGEEWSLEFLRRGDTLVHPGELYGWEQPGGVVVSLLVPGGILEEGVKRLLRVLHDAVVHY